MNNKNTFPLIFFLLSLLGLSYVIYDLVVSGFQKNSLLQLFLWTLLTFQWFVKLKIKDDDK